MEFGEIEQTACTLFIPAWPEVLSKRHSRINHSPSLKFDQVSFYEVFKSLEASADLAEEFILLQVYHYELVATRVNIRVFFSEKVVSLESLQALLHSFFNVQVQTATFQSRRFDSARFFLLRTEKLHLQ